MRVVILHLVVREGFTEKKLSKDLTDRKVQARSKPGRREFEAEGRESTKALSWEHT